MKYNSKVCNNKEEKAEIKNLEKEKYSGLESKEGTVQKSILADNQMRLNKQEDNSQSKMQLQKYTYQKVICDICGKVFTKRQI